MLGQLKEGGFINQELYTLAKEEKIVLSVQPRAFYAPHFAQFINAYLPTDATYVYTTLDRELQTQVEQIIKNNLSRLSSNNVTNAAVVVVDNATGGVLAYVGSADFSDKKHSGQVDGARALRQPGSALKPFVYALTFQTHRLTPATLLADEDTFFEGGFRPRNYDETYHGLVSVRNALGCSYNIPAVKAAEKVGTTQLLASLRKSGFASLAKTADFYGLGLALGNGEVKLLELVNAYATLGRGGIFKPLLLATSPEIKLPGHTTRVWDEKTSYLVSNILADNQARSGAFGLNSALSVPFMMAAKTGTSKDYKDNFALGYTTRWTVGVWVGNFDASSMQKVSGVSGAGPILHDVALEVQQRYPAGPFAAPVGIVRNVVCSQSGLLAGPHCTHTHEEVFDKAYVPVVCEGKHRAVPVQLEISSPQNADKFVIDPAAPRASQQLQLAATCAQQTCYWTVDGGKVTGTSCQAWWPLQAGKHTAAVACGGQTAQTTFEVLE